MFRITPHPNIFFLINFIFYSFAQVTGRGYRRNDNNEESLLLITNHKMFSCSIKVCILNTTSINIYALTRTRFEDACFVLQTADCAVSDLPRARRTAVFYPFSFRITTGLWTGCPLRPLCCQIFLVWHYVRQWEKCKWIVTCTNLRVLFRMFWLTTNLQLI